MINFKIKYFLNFIIFKKYSSFVTESFKINSNISEYQLILKQNKQL